MENCGVPQLGDRYVVDIEEPACVGTANGGWRLLNVFPHPPVDQTTLTLKPDLRCPGWA